MKKHRLPSLLTFVMMLLALTAFFAAPAHALHEVVIPYSYVADNWDTVLVVSNISGKNITPIVDVVNGSTSVCTVLDTLEPGEIYFNTLSTMGGWNGTPPIPGIFQVHVTVNELGSTDEPFGVAVAISNASYGGYGFQQFKSEYISDALRICVSLPLP